VKPFACRQKFRLSLMGKTMKARYLAQKPDSELFLD
jgi:hypothetical protein